MPYIRVTGVEKDELLKMSKDLIDIVNHDIGAKRENIRLFHSNDTEIKDGELVEGLVNIDITWMPRSKELCDKLAELYREYFFKAGYKGVKIYFSEIVKEKYYLY